MQKRATGLEKIFMKATFDKKKKTVIQNTQKRLIYKDSNNSVKS